MEVLNNASGSECQTLCPPFVPLRLIVLSDLPTQFHVRELSCRHSVDSTSRRQKLHRQSEGVQARKESGY